MAVAVTAFSVSLQWNEPQPANGIIRYYIVQYCQTSTPALITLFNDSIQMTSAMVINLSPFTDYTFRVSAVTVAEGPFVELNEMTAESGMAYIVCACHRVLNLAKSTHIHTHILSLSQTHAQFLQLPSI